ncbi:hypothetical protein ACHAWF_010432 [Thalassiosira exigua]
MTRLWPSDVFACQSGSGPDRPEDVADVCGEIRAGTKGFGTDEDALIKALGPLGPAERYHVAKRYEELHDIGLAKLMKKEASGDFGTALQLLASPIEEAEAAVLKKACKGVGTNEELVYTTLCGRANDEILAIKKAFIELHGVGLGSVLSGELSGDLKLLLEIVLEAQEEEYDPDLHTEDKAEEDAAVFDKAGLSRLGTDEDTLFKVILRSPPEHLKQVNMAFVDRTGYSLAKALEKELGGDAKQAALHTVNMKLKPSETAARVIEKSMKGMGTDEYGLTASILRYQALLDSIRPAYEKEFGKSLEERVRGELSGDFKKLILELISYSAPSSDVDE